MMAGLENLFEKFGRTYKPDEILFCEHEPGENVYLIQKGRIKLTKFVEDKEKTIDYLEDGDILGEMAILEQAPRSATAIAEGEVKVLEFNKQNFEALLKSQPQMSVKLLKSFSKRIYEAKRRLQVLRFPEAETKVMDTLLMLAEQKGYQHNEIEPIELETDPQQIASWCGLPFEETRKILTKHQNMGKIIIKAGRLIIKNISEFSRFVFNKRKLQDEENS